MDLDLKCVREGSYHRLIYIVRTIKTNITDWLASIGVDQFAWDMNKVSFA